MVAAAILSTKTVRAWKPKLLAMVGICAGVRGKVNLGDIVIGKQVFDYGSGKIEGGRLTPDYQFVLLNDRASAYLTDLASDSEALAQLRATWPTQSGKPDTELKAHVGPMGSGAAVVADDALIEGVRQNKRSLLAVDMEAYGVMRAGASALSPPIALVIKAVQDYADTAKNDEFREYAAFVSARFFRRFLDRAWRQLVELKEQ